MRAWAAGKSIARDKTRVCARESKDGRRRAARLTNFFGRLVDARDYRAWLSVIIIGFLFCVTGEFVGVIGGIEYGEKKVYGVVEYRYELRKVILLKRFLFYVRGFVKILCESFLLR